MDYIKKCEEAVASHAAYLHERVRAGKLRHSALSLLIESFISQPAYYPEHRPRLREIAENQCGGF